jgi:UDP-N-acetylmuramoylalanine--D-glutamate ligase
VKLEIKDKNITVVGLARSGLGAANLLIKLGADVTVTDIKKQDELKDFIPGLDSSVKLVLGGHPEEVFLSADMLVVSPGVPLDIQPLMKAKESGIPVIGELEFAYQILRNQIKFLAITGTNGKSTTTALLDFMMRKGGFRTILGGNIGNALTGEIYKGIINADNRKNGNFSLSSMGIDCIIAEVSSFQLESIKDFKPDVSGLLNITPDHLDRYHSFGEYSKAKARIFLNQRQEDFLVINRDDPETVRVVNEKLRVRDEKPEIVYFSRKEKIKGIYTKDGIIYCNPDNAVKSLSKNRITLLNADELYIKGVHNLENAMAASAMALLAGCPIEAVRESLREFQGLEHRLEFVKEIKGVRYFNDSKGTNVSAVIKSLESFKEPIILIAGGRDKAGDFSLLRDLVKSKVKTIVLIGEASEKIHQALGDITETVMAKDLKEAVSVSQSIARKGDVVLLSPACASFDMFLNFEDRGRQFKKIVTEMK